MINRSYDLRKNAEIKENLNLQQQNVLYSDASLKLNHDKKVRFAEQLAFKL